MADKYKFAKSGALLPYNYRKVPRMPNSTVIIALDAQAARAYDSASPEDKRKIQALLSLWLRELTTGQYPSLQQVLDEVGRKAKARGLTPEILDSILKGA